MSSSKQDDQRYIDSMAIVEAYERAAKTQQNRLSAIINMDASVGVLTAVLDAAELALEKMKPPVGESSDNVMLTSGGGDYQDISLEDSNNTSSENSCAPEEETAWRAKHIGGTAFEVGWDKDLSVEDPYGKLMKKLGIDATTDDIAEDLERCFGCDLRPNFDFQIRPVNFLAELMPLLDGIHDAIDQVLDALEPLDVLSWLCDLGDLFKDGFCLADLIAMLLAWQMLLQKYFGQMLRIALNWTFIIAPLIKFIVDLVTALLEQIRRLIIAPIDCSIKVLAQLCQLEDQLEETYDETAAFASMFPDFWDQKFGSKNNTSYSGVQSTGKKWGDQKNSYFKNVQNKDPKKVGMPTGLQFTAKTGLEDIFNQKKKDRKAARIQNKKDKYLKEKGFVEGENGLEPPKDITDEELKRITQEANAAARKPSALEMSLASTVSAKRYVNQLFANILLAVKSLNAFVVGTLGLSIQISGLILMLLDLIKFIVFIINTVKSNMSLKELCAKLESDPEYVEDLMNTWFKHDTRGNISKDREDWQQLMDDFKRPPEDDCTPES